MEEVHRIQHPDDGVCLRERERCHYGELLVEGSLPGVVRRLDGKFEAHNRVAVEYADRPVEKRTPQYPPSAFKQVTRNALLHRTYEHTNAPSRVTWYDDRIDVVSPGGPYGEVTAANFGTPGITDDRNPNLAEAMRVLGLVQRFGSGFSIAQQALSQNGNPELTWMVDAGFVCVTMRPVGASRIARVQEHQGHRLRRRRCRPPFDMARCRSSALGERRFGCQGRDGPGAVVRRTALPYPYAVR